MAEDLTDLVRTSCRHVMERAQLVVIDVPAVHALVAHLLTGAAPVVDAGAPPSVSPPSESALGLVLALDAINFGSGWHDVVRKRPGLSGARTMATALRDHVARTGFLSADRLMALTPGACADIFGQDRGHSEQMELMALFAAALGDLGRLAAEHYGGSFRALVESANGSAVALAEILLAMPMYRDRTDLDGRDVHFYKRAQITAADLHRETGGAPPCDFQDLHRLTAFADNLVPHVLRVDGVLHYDPELAAHIDAGQRLEPGSRAEVEIRAAGVHAVELVSSAAAEQGRPLPPMDLDLVLWTRGGAPRYKAVPRHRARSVYY